MKNFTDDDHETLFNFETNSVTQFLSFGSIPLYDMVLSSNLKADLISIDCILYQLLLKRSVLWLHKVDNKSTEYSLRTVATVEGNTERRNVANTLVEMVDVPNRL